MPYPSYFDFSSDFNRVGHGGSSSVQKFKKTRGSCIAIFELANAQRGDWVLDSFLGSGTTAAVAQKLGLKWIGVELGEHAYTHCLPRLRMVVDGNDLEGLANYGWTAECGSGITSWP